MQTKNFTYIFGGRRVRLHRAERLELLVTAMVGTVACGFVVAAILFLHGHVNL